MKKFKWALLLVTMTVSVIILNTTNCLAAITNIECNIVNTTNNDILLKATVTADVYGNLEDNNSTVTYSVYKDGSAITDFSLPTTPESSIIAVNDYVYKRDYAYSINKSDYVN